MKVNQGRLQTGEHILARIIEIRVRDCLMGVCNFKENLGTLEIIFSKDLKELSLN